MRGMTIAVVMAGALALTACGDDDDSSATESTPLPTATASPSSSSSASSSASPSGSASASSAPSASADPADALSEENLIRERVYFDVTGHSFMRKDLSSKQTLGPCTGKSTFADVLPARGVTTIGARLVGPEDGVHVIEQLAQTAAADDARTTADQIVSLVDECAAISGGDFGYGDPVTVIDENEKKVVYFPAFDSDRAFGGYVVFAVGSRVGVVEIADTIPVAQVEKLATVLARFAAD